MKRKPLIFVSKRFFATKIDPYLVLNLGRSASFQEIKKAYRQMARLYHPDLNKDDRRAQEKFMQVKEAFEEFEKKFMASKVKANEQAFRADETFQSIRETKASKTERRRKLISIFWTKKSKKENKRSWTV
jgi:DnaJ-class molecular chaperone